MSAAGGVGARGALGVVGVLVVVEFASGVLQGYYVPQLTDIARSLRIADADVNWLEGGQLAVSVVAVPILAKLGDLVGHRRVLLGALAATALASLGLAFVASSFPLFLALWAVQGAYTAWLPLEIALIAHRSRTRRIRRRRPARARASWSRRWRRAPSRARSPAARRRACSDRSEPRCSCRVSWCSSRSSPC